ncbi:dihydrodipicolinate synthase family protein [Allokutzneria sp. A3M-2-11 16]|uniref:dihydrodipicolinate synthase family protein n=1 Tax=Allokutzneria sp. A3M-2-11 16 TaxID=2962043 RepID=UPI0020B8FAE6|nr:dihydrodipicolinate synthase family protein [Allokutzneria sp. A3M-2-11 16]MCP3798410.1 dihydrodipicolinate synthase family protein [Allokutzneria sp. A3M-2-11 16]
MPEILTATPTFFDDAGELDRDTTKRHLADLAEHVDGVFVGGTTGEFPALDLRERQELAELALAAFGPARVVVHVGAASTRDAVKLARGAVAAGARRLAALTPYYLPVDIAAVTRHFAAITAVEGSAETYGYLFSERSGVVVEPAEFARIASDTGLAGAKLSGSAADRFDEYLAALPPGTPLWSGADTTLAGVIRSGGEGVVSGLTAAFPRPFKALANAVVSGDAEAERLAQQKVDDVLDALGGTIEGIKAALRHLGYGNGALRMPAPVLDFAAQQRIARLR